MSTRANSKRKAKRASQESILNEPLATSQRTEILSSEQFEEITQNVKNSVKRDIRDAVNEVEMRILQAIRDNDSGRPSGETHTGPTAPISQSRPGTSNPEFVTQDERKQ